LKKFLTGAKIKESRMNKNKEKKWAQKFQHSGKDAKKSQSLTQIMRL